MKQKLIELEVKIDKSPTIVRDFNTPFSVIEQADTKC